MDDVLNPVHVKNLGWTKGMQEPCLPFVLRIHISRLEKYQKQILVVNRVALNFDDSELHTKHISHNIRLRGEDNKRKASI